MTELSLQGSSIVNLPEGMAYLSSLKSLDLTDCKRLEYIPKLPPNLNHISAFDCPSIKRMMLNSRSDSEEGTFKFHLTNSKELDATSWSNIGEEACIKITDDAYKSVFFCFPGSAVPCWFHYCCKGDSVTMRKVSPNLCSKNKLTGLALCAVLGRQDMDDTFLYKFGFISDNMWLLVICISDIW
ncbi:NBS-LRR disease resistance protein [Trifolium medium]|uniref:NBS-LRR disease resistance protein n=1 Tax=Trifolium medium TaxID=97028 RepID=A0A392M0J2_9FABA|nr:NBS-LRR disease resistance protein [Trifolium medium]